MYSVVVLHETRPRSWTVCGIFAAEHKGTDRNSPRTRVPGRVGWTLGSVSPFQTRVLGGGLLESGWGSPVSGLRRRRGVRPSLTMVHRRQDDGGGVGERRSEENSAPPDVHDKGNRPCDKGSSSRKTHEDQSQICSGGGSSEGP